ncbi:MAG: carbohydrate-binding family 9-like protein [candidate division Zixibacteria bacterium]|nr:carbohydrate-binding family 9-like protein [candidate division Zixibacteria bacterium]
MLSSVFPWPEDRIEHYTAYRVLTPLVIGGRLDEPAWQSAPRSPRFRDLIHGEPGIHDTRSAVLWDDECLYIGFWVEEPNVTATLTERDSPIYADNDVEVFIAGKDTYYEFEINAFGTFYEVFFIWEEAYARGGYDKEPQFDRTKEGVRPFHGVGFQPHPRGPRIGYWNWDMPGLRTAVHVDGTINDPSDRDRGWTVELAFPWKSMEWLAKADGRALPPQNGDVWRIDFSRFNQYKQAPPSRDPGGWAWSPHGVWDSHVPECFPYIHFSTAHVVR